MHVAHLVNARGAAVHLLRRGVQSFGSMSLEDKPDNELPSWHTMPSWGLGLLAVTVFIFLVGYATVNYTFGHVVPTLVMIESPQALLFEPVALDDTDADATIAKTTEPELLLVKQKPITSSFRGTFKHLQSIGGFRSRFRGISLFVVYSLGFAWTTQCFAALPFVPRSIASIVATMLFANLSLAWTHIVISEASPKPWYRRLPSPRIFKKIAGPTAVFAIASQLARLVPTLMVIRFRLAPATPEDVSGMTPAEKNMVVVKAVSVLLVSLALFFMVALPAQVTLTRVQASLLSDDQETIVPFDRSFGGKVIPEIVGGTGVISMREAWKTFDWNARVRLLKAYAKVFLMQTGLSVLFFFTIFAELLLIVGKSDMKKWVPSEPSNGGEI